MASVVYLLCALTSMACAGLLLRQYRRSGLPLLLWSSLAFLLFALANGILFIDLAVVMNYDLSLWRNAVTLAGVVLLLQGMIRMEN